MNVVQRAQSGVDRWQRRRPATSVIFAVVKKYGNERGGQLAAVIAYFGFLSLFPLLLILVTVLGFVLAGDPSLQNRLLHSALADFPLIGNQLKSAIHPLRGQGAGVGFGLLGVLWGSLGVTQAAQSVMADVWSLPPTERPGFWPRLGRGLGLLALIGLGVGVTAGASFVTFGSAPWIARVGTVLLTTTVNVGLYLVGFRLLTVSEIPTRDLVPGAVLGGIGWEILQLAGGYLVGHTLRHATEVYGTFGVVLGLMGWLYLAAQLMVYAAELNVVLARHLWPIDFFAVPNAEPTPATEPTPPPSTSQVAASHRAPS